MTKKTETPPQPKPLPSATDIYIAGLEAEGRQLRISGANLRARIGELEARIEELEKEPSK